MDRLDIDEEHLREAIRLAARGPEVDPNPRVGAVVVDASGAVVGRGWHAGAGTPHAEVLALAEAGARAEGGTAYISLEPCRHHGRTPPCTDALLAARIRRVVYAQADPDPVAGGGAGRLRAAGIETTPAADLDQAIAEEAAALNEAWTFSVRHSRPRVIWKTATSLDGRAAAADGTSRWITGPEARRDVHALRARCGAVLIGTGTALADDPRLTSRAGDGSETGRQPLRVVLGVRDLPPGSALASAASGSVLRLRHRDPQRALAGLHERGIRQVLLEGGPTLAAAFLRAGLIDRVVVHLAPLLLGAGRLLPDFGVTTLAGGRQLTIVSVDRRGPDVVVVADLPRRPTLVGSHP